MRTKIFFIAFSLLVISNATLAQVSEPIIKDNNHLIWKPIPHSPSKYAVLVGDPTKKEYYVVRIKIPPQVTMSPHTHSHYEYNTVISGTCYVAVGDKVDANKLIPIHAGQFFMMPPNIVHYGGTKDVEAIVQDSGMGPWEPIMPRG